MRRDLGDVLEIIDEMRDSLGRFVACGVEADEVGERAVAEERLDGPVVGMDAPALEKLGMFDVAAVPRRIVLEAAEEVSFVGAEIIEAGLDHERNDFRRDGALRGPEAARTVTEDLRVEFLREAKLGADIFRCGEGRGERRLGLAPARDVGVVDQRHDRVEIGRGCQLDLAPLGRGAVFGQDEAEDFAMDVEHGVLFLLGEVAALFLQLPQERKPAHGGEAAPLKIVEGLEIAEIASL